MAEFPAHIVTHVHLYGIHLLVRERIVDQGLQQLEGPGVPVDAEELPHCILGPFCSMVVLIKLVTQKLLSM